MKRTKLRDRKLPPYTRGEEVFNMVSHIVGGTFAIGVLITCVVIPALRGNVWGIVGGTVFGLSMILVYTISSVYHGLIPETPKKVLQVIDHCAIFVLIAGTYTPIALVAVRPLYPALAWGQFAFIWGVSALGITLNAIDLHKYRVFSMICYVGLGWSLLLFPKQLMAAMPTWGLVWLIAGGVSYTVGSVLYNLGKKRRYMHSVFHLFVVLGSVLHFLCVVFCLAQ